MARRKKKSKSPAEAFARISKSGRRKMGLGLAYNSVKREYHRLGDELYRSKHGGRSIKSRKRRTKHRRTR
jgi:hypothetical protein